MLVSIGAFAGRFCFGTNTGRVSPGNSLTRAKAPGSLSVPSTGSLQVFTDVGPQEPRVHLRQRGQGLERPFIPGFRVGQRVDEQDAFAAQHAQSAALAAKLLTANGDSGGFGR